MVRSEVQQYVGLLRGVNVGGKHCLPMKDLVSIFIQLGCSNVRTYIQSGNVIFDVPQAKAGELPALVSREIEKRFEFAAPVILRDRKALSRVVNQNPFLKTAVAETALHVYFLADPPTTAAVKGLDANRSVPDEFRVVGQHIYLHTPNGMGRTKLTSTYFDSKLATICTARNWATVNKLLEMMQPQVR